MTALFHKFKSDLDKMCMVNALNLKENDLQFIGKLNEISNNLEVSLWELEDFGKEKEVSGAEQAPEAKVEEVEKEPVNEKKRAGAKKEKKEQNEKDNNTEAA